MWEGAKGITDAHAAQKTVVHKIASFLIAEDMLDNEYWRAIGDEATEFWHYVNGNQCEISNDEKGQWMREMIALCSSEFVLPMAMALS